jgi:hypothetical protein
MIGDIFVVYGGFNKEWGVASNSTYTLDTSNPAATWQKVDDIPIGAGLTHGAHVRIGTKIYNCGGYVGGHPGLHTAQCIVYDQSQPIGQRWSSMTPLPDGRGGGGVFYNTALNALYYVTRNLGWRLSTLILHGCTHLATRQSAGFARRIFPMQATT